MEARPALVPDGEKNDCVCTSPVWGVQLCIFQTILDKVWSVRCCITVGLGAVLPATVRSPKPRDGCVT